MKHVIIFASGSGSNAENIIHFFENNPDINVVQVFTNNSRAKVIERCKKLNVKCLVFDREAFYQSNEVLDQLKLLNPDLIVLAGFLWKIPEALITAFPEKIINIHPALLPKYGGKGMYGRFVHEAVVANNESESGISIHYVNENYDEGAIIFQAKCQLTPNDTSEDVAHKVHDLEMEHFPTVIESLLYPDG